MAPYRQAFTSKKVSSVALKLKKIHESIKNIQPKSNGEKKQTTKMDKTRGTLRNLQLK